MNRLIYFLHTFVHKSCYPVNLYKRSILYHGKPSFSERQIFSTPNSLDKFNELLHTCKLFQLLHVICQPHPHVTPGSQATRDAPDLWVFGMAPCPFSRVSWALAFCPCALERYQKAVDVDSCGLHKNNDVILDIIIYIIIYLYIIII